MDLQSLSNTIIFTLMTSMGQRGILYNTHPEPGTFCEGRDVHILVLLATRTCASRSEIRTESPQVSLRCNGHFSRWTWVSRCQNVSIPDFIGVKDDEDGGDTDRAASVRNSGITVRTDCVSW